MIFRAIKFVAEAHEGHYRKGTNIPYISHLTNVMKILCENGCSEEVIVAGILHDAVEDTPISLDVIKLKFGNRVAELVAAASEKEKLETGDQEEAGWKERKQHTINSLQKTDSVDKLLVSCADKLDNTRAIAGLQKTWRRSLDKIQCRKRRTAVVLSVACKSFCQQGK